MVFDDLQWADSPSRDLIGYLMRSIENEPLLIVGLVRRGGTIDPQHPLAEWMRLQANYRSYTSLTLRPLSEQACGTAIQADLRWGIACSRSSTGGPPHSLQADWR